MYPNPATDYVKLEVYSSINDEASITVYDLSGRAVIRKAMVLTAGENTVSLETAELSKGIYMLEIATGENGSVKQRLMIGQ